MHIFREQIQGWNLLSALGVFGCFPKELKCQSTVPSNVTWDVARFRGVGFFVGGKNCLGCCGMLLAINISS